MVIFQGVGKVFEEAGIRGGNVAFCNGTYVCACVYTLTGNMSI